jgi:hypothetical protein
MASLAGMQITGNCGIIPKESSEYGEVMDLKGIKMSAIEALPVNMNVIKIGLEKVEFLYWKFREDGYDARQIITF